MILVLLGLASLVGLFDRDMLGECLARCNAISKQKYQKNMNARLVHVGVNRK